MSNSTMGAIIEQGPQNWQIIQQELGFGDIYLSGRWATNEKVSDVTIHVRVVLEDTGESIISWTLCQPLSGQRWEVLLKDIPVGGLYRIETCMNHAETNGAIEWATRGDMIHHVGVGDLYVIAGQSNAAGYGKDPVYDPPEVGVHILRNRGQWDLASHPLNESTDTIHEVNMEQGNPGHSPYLHFAKMLKKNLGYPIGLLQSSLGGSPLRLWNPDENGALYRNMMDIINSQGGSIKGILWYQGCSDAATDICETYLQRFGNMLECTRRDLKIPDLPFLTVQLNRCLGLTSEEENHCWGIVREAQRQAVEKIPYVYIVPALDCGLSDTIHNSSSANLLLGERLARVALSEIYGRRTRYKAPNLKSARQIENNKVLLEFNNVYGRLDMLGVEPAELPFTVEDQEGTIDVIGYKLEENNKIILTFGRPLSSRSVIHGAYEKNPKCFLPIDFETHLPILAFYGVKIE